MNGFHLPICSIISDESGIIYINKGFGYEILSIKLHQEFIKSLENSIQALKNEKITENDISLLNQSIKKEYSNYISSLTQKGVKIKKYSSLYLMQDTSSKNLKIGISKNVEARLKSINTNSHSKVVLLYEIKEGSFLEKDLHLRFNEIRLNGEWFDYSEEIINTFKELKNEQND